MWPFPAGYTMQNMTAPPHLTTTRCWGCRNKYWLSSSRRLLEFRVQARGCGLRTINGGWVSSLKCNSNSKLFLSSKVWMTSKSCNTVCRATQPETRCKDNTQNTDRNHAVAPHLCTADEACRFLVHTFFPGCSFSKSPAEAWNSSTCSSSSICTHSLQQQEAERKICYYVRHLPIFLSLSLT